MKSFDQLGENCKDAERGLQFTTGAIILTVIAALPGYQEPASIAAIAHRFAFLEAIVGFGGAFLMALCASYIRFGAAAIHFPSDHPFGEKMNNFQKRFVPNVWYFAMAATVFLLLVASTRFIANLANAEQLEINQASALPDEMRARIDHLAGLKQILPWDWFDDAP